MLYKLLLFLLTLTQLYSQIIIKEIYPVNSRNIYTTDISATLTPKKLLYTIEEHKYIKRIKATKLIKSLNNNGNNDAIAHSRYIKFQLKSPIDTSIIETYIRQYYLQKYSTINIRNITVMTRGYIDSLPDKYIVNLRKRAYLNHNDTINIKDMHNKKIFFNYTIDATIKIIQTKRKIKRNNKISFFNTQYKTIQFDKFKALPLMNLEKDTLQSKRTIKENTILTLNDVEYLDLVHKNAQVSANFFNRGIYITFSAKALQNGKLGDIITIQKSDLKRLKAKVIGKERVEIQ